MKNIELQYCRMLHEIAKSLGTAKNVKAIQKLIVKSAVDNLKLKASSIRLLSKDKKTLTLEAAYGLSDEYLKKGPVEVDQSPIDRDAIKGKPVIVKEVEQDARMLQYPDEAKKESIASMICVPLTVKDEVIGSLRGYTSKIREFSNKEITFLKALGNLGAIAIENARLNERLIKKTEIMKKLLNTTQAITSILNRKKILNAIIKSAVETLKTRGCSLWRIDEKKEKLELASLIGLYPQDSTKGAVRVSEEKKEILEGKIVTIGDISLNGQISEEKRESLNKEGISSILAVPMIKKNKTIGVIEVYDTTPRNFMEDEIEFLSLLAGIGGIAIENARLYELALNNWQKVVKSLWEKLDVWKAT